MRVQGTRRRRDMGEHPCVTLCYITKNGRHVLFPCRARSVDSVVVLSHATTQNLGVQYVHVRGFIGPGRPECIVFVAQLTVSLRLRLNLQERVLLSASHHQPMHSSLP